YDYIGKPFNLDDVVLKVAKALERRNLVLQNKEYQHHLEEMVEEQRARLQRQFVELIPSLAREHALVYERETSRGRKRGRQEPLEQLPSELRKPISSVQEFAAALLRIIEEGRMLRDKGSEKVT
ncbi:MAG: hypothetical protein IIC02_08465, partial [Planctomycetes bacterium]|nr:hypothetical protein [Planctomycetota bacterium]